MPGSAESGVKLIEGQFVEWHIGTYPVLVTCPHDGRRQPPGVPERPDEQDGCASNKKLADLSTRSIATGLCEAIEARTGAMPSMVAARFHRRFIDANRKASCAFEAPAAAPFYDAYHRRIRLALNSIRRDFPKRGLLVDIHGAADPADLPEVQVLLGTDGHKSIARLLELDPNMLWRRGGLVRKLEAAGFGVVPATSTAPEHANFDGGFTIRRYGASHPTGLDAVQVEIVRSVRLDPSRRTTLIGALARGLISVLVRQQKLVQS
jgi:N-formylglutamate amidohydrolase